ncbi:MAG: hypothetical protein ACLUKN_11835 [Bacilli bacterium]
MGEKRRPEPANGKLPTRANDCGGHCGGISLMLRRAKILEVHEKADLSARYPVFASAAFCGGVSEIVGDVSCRRHDISQNFPTA